MTASDVKASIEAVEPTSWGQEFASTIKSIEVVNPLTVEIDTNGPDPLMLNELTKLYIYDTTSGKQNNPINGTGPYTLASDTTNDVELTAFNDYWGGHIYTRRVDFLNYYPASTIPTNLMKTKQLQLVVVPNDPTFVSTLKGYGYQILDQSAYAVGQIVFDTLKPGSPLASTAVRRALAEAVNKPELISVSDNTGSPPINQIVPQGIPGYDPSIPAPVYSVTKAKADLAAAGYPNGFSFNFAYVPTSSTTGLIDELQKELGDIGVTVVPDPTTSEDTFANIVEQGGADSYYDVLSSDYVDGSDIMSFFIDSPYFSNPALDVLNTQASKTLDQTKRVQILEQMNAMIASDQADIPLFQRDNLVQATAPSVVIENDTVATALLGTYFYHDYQK
jgi:peptide/nickel transport system substrate-binding protein